ncbi:25720_t:CDS:1, partial [Gigaspora margarita]
MNIAEREENFLAYSTNKKYKGYWLSAAEEKKKGSGIGILIEEQWKKHIGAVKRVSEYMIEITLFLKQMELVIIGVYMSPNDKIAVKKLQQKIVEVVFKRKNQMQIAIMGDFNHIVDNVLDRMHTQI